MNVFSVMHLLRTLRLCRNAGHLSSSSIRRPDSYHNRVTYTSTMSTVQLQSHFPQCQLSRLLSYYNIARTPQVERDATSVGLCPSSFCLFVSRQSSSKSTNIDKDVEVEGNADENEWSHPASRTEDAFTKDPELRSLLCEIASDFGRSQTVPTDPEPTVIGDGPSSDKQTPVVLENGEASDVFSIDDIVDILREENAQDICVIAVPPEKNYVDYFIVVTGRSTRHLSAMTQYINKLYKQRKGKGDPFLSVEGKFTDDWMCLDFGNIVVHFMLEETRAVYNLEELWTLGKDFDDHIQHWKQHETLLFNPEMDLQTHADEGEESKEK